MAATAIGPIGARQINQSFFVGQSDLTTIQKAVNAAVQNGGGIAIIPFDYAGSDTIAAITGGSTYVEIHDYRNPGVQAYVWFNNTYIPADFTQAGNAIIDGFMHIKGILEVDGNSDLKGTLTVEQGITGPAEVNGDLAASGNISAVTFTASNSMITHTLRAAIANESYLVGPGGFATIQLAINAAVAATGGTVIVPWDYAGSDTIAAATGGINGVIVKDYRNPSVQAWVWSGTSYNIPATFDQAGNLTIHGVSQFDGHVSMGGNLDVTGNLTAQDAKFSTCEINGIPVKNMVFPAAGLGLSTGTAWGTSIDPATLQGKLTLTTTGSSGPATLAGNALNIPQYAGGGMVFPAAGIGVSTGTAWGTSIDPTTLQGKLTLTTSGTSGAATLAGNALNIPQYTAPAQVYPAAGLAVSTGTAWGTPIATANVALLNAGNVFTVGQTIGTAGALRLAITPSGTAIYFDSNGPNVTTNGAFIYRTAHSDGGNLITAFTVDSGGNGFFNGTVNGTAKNFRITHPLDETKDLVHSCLEGPETAVFYRGEAQVVDGYAVVTLPDYFEALTYPEDRSVQLTQVWEDVPLFARLAASRVVDGKFTIHATDDVTVAWEVKAVRRIGVERLKVVQDKPEPEPQPAQVRE